jgi:hypothetical protein
MFSEHNACFTLKTDSDIRDFDVRASFIDSTYSWSSRLYRRCVCVCMCVFVCIYTYICDFNYNINNKSN